MNNAQKPKLEDLPSPTTLFRSSIIAVIGALTILIAVVLPAEYAIDPTGAGRLLGLTEMGEIKRELAEEAERDLKFHGRDQSFNLFDGLLSRLLGTAYAQETKEAMDNALAEKFSQDEVIFTLAPSESAEIKLKMAAGDTAQYTWHARGGRINFDLHAHGNGESINYERGRGEASGEGSITAPFAGDHGWFWRNRDDVDVTITLQLRGSYEQLIESY